MFVDVLSARVRVFGWKEYAGVRVEAEKFLPAAAEPPGCFRFSSSLLFLHFVTWGKQRNSHHFLEKMSTAPLPTTTTTTAPEGGEEEAATTRTCENPYVAPETKRKPDVRARDFEMPAGLARLESILARIYVEESFASTAYADRMDAKAVVECILELLQGNEECLGIKAPMDPKARRLMKIPAHVFGDLKPSGSLFRILLCALEAKASHNWRNFSWVSEQRKSELIEDVYKRAERELKTHGFLKHKKVYIPPPLRKYLKDAVKATRVAVADKPTDAGVTHCIEIPRGQDILSSLSTRGSEFTRTVRVDRSESLLHYSYHPDSYDCWVPNSSGNAPPYMDMSEAVPKNGKAWVVNPLWLLDSASFNEWMNELDYRANVEDDLNNQQQQQQQPQQQNAGGGEEKKRKERELNDALGKENLSSRATERLDFRITRQYVVDQHPFIKASADFDVDKSSGVASADPTDDSTIEANKRLIQLKKKICLENLTHGQLPSAAFPSVVNVDANNQNTAATAQVDDSSEENVGAYRIPVHCSIWFDWSEASEVEKRSLPEFFISNKINGNKNRTKSDGCYEQNYITLRNAIINAYKALKPGVALMLDEAFKTCKGLEKNEMKVRRVFSFLERWNVINWPWSKGATRNIPRVNSLSASAVTLVSSDLLEKIKHLESRPGFEHDPYILVDSKCLDAKRNSSTCSQRQMLKLKIISEMKCSSCDAPLKEDRSSEDAKKKYYYHLVDGFDCDLCEGCFSSARFPEGLQADKFDRVQLKSKVIDKATGESKQDSRLSSEGGSINYITDDDENLIQIGFEDWNETELLALLEALENYGISNWKEVADYVQTRTAEDCIRAFVALPIQDAVLNDLQKRTIIPRGVAIDDARDAKEYDFCAKSFDEKLCNPVLARISFLSTMLSPRIAAVAAREAMLKLLENKVNEEDEITDGEFVDSANALFTAAILAVKNAAIGEEIEIERLSSSIAENRIKKCHIKLHQYRLLEDVFHREKEIMATARKEAKSEIEIFALAASKHKETIERYTEMEDKITAQIAKLQEATALASASASATAAATASAAAAPIATATATPPTGQQQQQQQQ